MKSTLVSFLGQPSVVDSWLQEDWNSLVQQAYATGMQARVFAILQQNDFLAYVPENLLWHFSSAYKVFLAHQQDVLNETARIIQALKMANIVPVFLKGAAYLLDNDQCSDGRLFSDIDIFVSKAELSATEEMLRWNGWLGKELDAHDTKYYRDWMHEIPPMTNSRSGMSIDVHHNLVPLVSRIRLNGESLLAQARLKENGYRTLSAEDKVLHSAAHLLLDGEFNHGFRDLHDLYLLLTNYMNKDINFLEKLCFRAKELGFEVILFYCLSLQIRFFNLAVPQKIILSFDSKLLRSDVSKLMLSMYVNVLRPDTAKYQNRRYKTSLFLLFIRSHWLKMPLHILIPHLLYKAFITPYADWKKQKELQKEMLNG